MTGWILALVLFLGLAQSDQVTITVHLLDEQNHPLAGITVAVSMVLYGDDGISEVPGGTCVTDEKGTCSVTVIDPPRLSSGWTEAFIEPLELGLGRDLIGWYGDAVDVWLYASDLRLAATVEAMRPLEYYLGTETRVPSQTPTGLASTPTPTATGTNVPSPTAQKGTNVPNDGTFVPSTATPESSHTPTATLIPVSTPSSRAAAGPLIIALGLLVFALAGVAIGVAYWRQRGVSKPAAPVAEAEAAPKAPEQTPEQPPLTSQQNDPGPEQPDNPEEQA